MTYKAPVRDTLFVLQELAGLEAIATIPSFEAADADTVQAINRIPNVKDAMSQRDNDDLRDSGRGSVNTLGRHILELTHSQPVQEVGVGIQVDPRRSSFAGCTRSMA